MSLLLVLVMLRSKTLSCDNVAADRVRVKLSVTFTASSASRTKLNVFEIEVSRVSTKTIGLYLVSARILSSETLCASTRCRVSCGSAFLNINHNNSH